MSADLGTANVAQLARSSMMFYFGMEGFGGLEFEETSEESVRACVIIMWLACVWP